MKQINLRQYGFSLVELMVAALLGLIVSFTLLQIYLSQTQMYKTSNSQQLILSVENALSNLVIPVIRSAGFLGCGTVANAMTTLNSGGPPPISTINTLPTLVAGYSSGGSTITLTQNPVNSSSAGDWTPALPTGLAGSARAGSDVIVALSAAPGAHPIGVTAIDTTGTTLSVQSTAGARIAAGQFGAVSDCVKSLIFKITGVGATTISHAAGGGILDNSTAAFPISFQVGSQFIQLQQTAFFVGQSQGGQSALMRATLVGNSWTVEPIVPGIELMKIQYGIGPAGSVNRYVPASGVSNWGQVYSVRIAFLIAGQQGSAIVNTATFNLLGTQVNVPTNNRLRHMLEITIYLRNSLS